MGTLDSLHWFEKLYFRSGGVLIIAHLKNNNKKRSIDKDTRQEKYSLPWSLQYPL